MKLSMTRQEKGDLFNTGDCLIGVTACAGLIVFLIIKIHCCGYI